ncbi:MAG: hypothetical protein ACP5R5_01140 [Armatimonadota bacterium]
MESSELSIVVGELIGIPRITLRGNMEAWHDQAVLGVLTGFADREFTSLVLDIAGVVFVGPESLAAMVNVLRSIGPNMCIHVAASARMASALRKAVFGPSVRLYSSTDEIAEQLTPDGEFFTSRWIASGEEDEQMPKAA